MNCWINIYKARGISSAKSLSIIRKAFNDKKVGHTGTLDLEAEGVLPVAVGEATKLVNVLMNAKKKYEFTIKFGSQTDTGDSAGTIINSTEHIPTREECYGICAKFLGKIKQIPPKYSALKVNGQRAYKLARDGKDLELPERQVTIYDLKCVDYKTENSTATYVCECSKGTYIRSLAEDISLSLQSLGFVIELRRLGVGIFNISNSLDLSDLSKLDLVDIKSFLQDRCLKIEDVLDDIPVLEANDITAKKIRFGQKCIFPDNNSDYELVWIRHKGQIVAVGSLLKNNFKSSRVFNL